MVIVRIDKSLINNLEKKFNKSELSDLKKQFKSLEQNPFQGDIIAVFGAVVLKEKKYKSFRFYFIHSKNILVIKDLDKLKDEIIRFIEYSKKNNQQRTIEKLKKILEQL